MKIEFRQRSRRVPVILVQVYPAPLWHQFVFFYLGEGRFCTRIDRHGQRCRDACVAGWLKRPTFFTKGVIKFGVVD